VQERVYFDDIDDGLEFASARRTITEADIVNFAGVTGDFNPIHMDEVFAATETPFGRRVAHGLLGLAFGTGLRCEIDRWHVLAFLECRRSFLAPVFPGDTVHCHYRVAERKESRSKSDRGVVTLEVHLVNQRGETVQQGENVLLVARPADGTQ
jgi:3-hydroxybutyryl-CoA dehydratase